MRKLTVAILLVLALVLTAATAEEAQQTGLLRDVLVLFTSDVHCGVDQNFGYAGLQAVREAAIKAGNYVLLVDDGDSIQGESIGVMTKGEANIRLMNAVGYDVAIPGNHEFDYGMDRFFELAEMAEFPYISCNFVREGELVFNPYVIMEFEGAEVAFVGVTTPETMTSSTPRYFQNEEGEFIYDFSQGGDGSGFYAKVQEAVDDARAQGADYVIVMAHLGNEASVAPYTYADLIENTNGIDALLDGHSHDYDKVVMKNKDGNMVVRQACGTKLSAIGWLRISAKDGSIDTGLYTWDNKVSAPELFGLDNELSRLVAEETEDIYAQLSEVVGTANVDLIINDPVAVDENGRPIRISRSAETNLGDLAADAFRAAAGADIGFMTGGGMRTGLDKGDITVEDVLGVVPFGNKLGMVEATGQQILNALEYGASVVPGENGAFIHPSGLTYEIHTYIDSSVVRDDDNMYAGVEGEYRVKNVMVGGEPLDLDKVYTVAAASYVLVDHGDGQTAFDGAKLVWESDDVDYTYLVSYIKDTLGGVVGDGYEEPYGQGRVVAVEEAP
ncbi:MAG: bifunctional metallophosphatase/5'-nucleotidase [Clostridiales bacterium]|nr:bifunctional metallophosphatase/5'-nucleotidase [Clostridiales bacterium]